MSNERILISRNKREGLYAGKVRTYDANHRRSGPDCWQMSLRAVKFVRRKNAALEIDRPVEMLFDWVVF